MGPPRKIPPAVAPSGDALTRGASYRLSQQDPFTTRGVVISGREARETDAYWPGTAGAAGFETGLTLRARLDFHPSCMDDPDLFFAESPAAVEAAKAMCRGCPIRLACLSGARERREPWGVWGGELFLRGRIVPRKRGRGRPRKADAA